MAGVGRPVAEGPRSVCAPPSSSHSGGCGCLTFWLSYSYPCMNGGRRGGRRLRGHAASAHHLQAVADPDRRRDEDPEQSGGAQAGALRLFRRDPARGKAYASNGGEHRPASCTRAVTALQEFRRWREWRREWRGGPKYVPRSTSKSLPAAPLLR